MADEQSAGEARAVDHFPAMGEGGASTPMEDVILFGGSRDLEGAGAASNVADGQRAGKPVPEDHFPAMGERASTPIEDVILLRREAGPQMRAVMRSLPVPGCTTAARFRR